jgi:hypothetical protein
LEEQVRGVVVEGEVADLIDDQELVAAQSLQSVFEPAGGVGGGEAVDPIRGGIKLNGVVGLDGFDAGPIARCVSPTLGGPSRTTFSAFATQVVVAKCPGTSRRSEG